MNEFVMDASINLTPDEIVWCVMETRTEQLDGKPKVCVYTFPVRKG